MDTNIIFGLIASSLIGLAIGQTRGRPLAGFFLGLLIGPIGWLLVLVGPNPKKEKEEKEKQAVLQQQLSNQKAQLEAIQQLQVQSITSKAPTIRIAKDGNDLGDMDIPKVKLMLLKGELSQQDYYFDAAINNWLPIESHPDLAT